jgi:hypothetical protein
MRVRFCEVTNGPGSNWGKFMVARFDEEWARVSLIDGGPLIGSRGWTDQHVLVFDLQTGEGAIFLPGGYAHADLEKHKIWVCPLFEPFLEWLYQQPDPLAIPARIDLPNAEFAMYGYRRPGSTE